MAIIARELTMFAAFGLIVGGIDDLAIDLLWLVRVGWRRLTVYRVHGRGDARSLPPPRGSGPIAIFVPAWDEADVIGAMLRTALARLDHADYRIFVGLYPNDPATADAVLAIGDARVEAVSGLLPGPTTKAECLNRCWRALRAHEAATGRCFRAVLLHDAEDLVHPQELTVVDRLIGRFDLLQLPVLPLIDRGAQLVSGHYADEFAEMHGRHLPLREALGAGIPAAGVGCALARDVLERIAIANGGPVFDETSLTEDYEIGLRLRGHGARGAFVAIPAGPGEPLVAVRAYFPATLEAAVRQKTRWLIGIACAGWDRLGWRGGIAERWMRLRDRKAILAAVVLAAAYLSLIATSLCWLLGVVIAWPRGFAIVMAVTTGLLTWRLAMRFLTVRHFYGWREAAWSIPRMLIGNVVLMMAARRAIWTYVPGATPPWDKTRHRFPYALPCD